MLEAWYTESLAFLIHYSSVTKNEFDEMYVELILDLKQEVSRFVHLGVLNNVMAALSPNMKDRDRKSMIDDLRESSESSVAAKQKSKGFSKLAAFVKNRAREKLSG